MVCYGPHTAYNLWPPPPTTAFASVDSCMLRTRHAPPRLNVFVLRANPLCERPARATSPVNGAGGLHKGEGEPGLGVRPHKLPAHAIVAKRLR